MPSQANKGTDPQNVAESSTLKKDVAESELGMFATFVLEEVEVDVEQDVETSPAEKKSSAKEDGAGSKTAKNPNAENVVNVDELSDNDLISNAVPVIAKRLKSKK